MCQIQKLIFRVQISNRLFLSNISFLRTFSGLVKIFQFDLRCPLALAVLFPSIFSSLFVFCISAIFFLISLDLNLKVLFSSPLDSASLLVLLSCRGVSLTGSPTIMTGSLNRKLRRISFARALGHGEGRSSTLSPIRLDYFICTHQQHIQDVRSSAGFRSFSQLSTSCQMAAGQLLAGDFRTCANLMGLVKILETQESLVAPINIRSAE
ncbi:hypothetical protein VP01_642g2 [Puccinia sorghi]|uniref:Uncharacterized protein n=1 Tax=Puccinia sorghi TaxID=27349 RepID=A0A0L6UGM7_9BASI|nr:hypothetical protein VP01_642g2 [Puccinia sorghi]